MADNSTVSVAWDDIKHHVSKLNKKFYELIENDPLLRPDKLSIVSYDYGSQVGDEAFFYYPNQQKTPIMPFCMVYENNFEMYMQIHAKTSPWKIYKPGQVFPYTKFLTHNQLHEPSDMLKMTAGTRNSFLLMNQFSDKKKHTLLQKKYHLRCPPPMNFLEQFFVFKEIIDCIKPTWKARLLIFPSAWEKIAYQSPAFLDYLNSVITNEYLFKQNVLLYDHLINNLYAFHKITSNSFIKEVLRQLFFVACGDQLAYLPTSNETNAPIALLREAYIETFKSDTIPIFMVPHKLSPFHSEERVYYSLNKEDLLFKPNQISNLNKLSTQIIQALECLCKKIHDSRLAQNTIFYQCTNNIDVQMIHRWNIKHGKVPPDNPPFFYKDPYLMGEAMKYPQLEFPSNSLFLSGCFSIGYKTHYDPLNPAIK
jgi:hypothetical protein